MHCHSAEQKQKTVSLVFHESNAFIETISGCQTAQGQALKKWVEEEEEEEVLHGSEKKFKKKENGTFK